MAVQLFEVHVRYTNSVRRRSVGPEELGPGPRLGAGRLDYLRLRQTIRRRVFMLVVADWGLCMPTPISRVPGCRGPA